MNNQGLRFSALWLGLGWLVIAVIFYFSLSHHSLEPHTHLPIDKVEHFSAYVGLMWWFSQLYTRTSQRVWLAIALVGMGILVEILQGMTGYRDMSAGDAVADTLGILVGWWLVGTRFGNVLSRLDQKLVTRRAS